MNAWSAGILGVAVGVAALVGLRLVVASPAPPTHYHANFAVVIDGERLDLSHDRYMQEYAACGAAGGTVAPSSRVHLHNNDQDVVHVHHGGATWGHLMANLGMVLGDRVLVTPDGDLLVDDEMRTLTFILNGRPVRSVYNLVIRRGDRLLISYGAESEQEVLETQFSVVASNAEEYEQRSDPAGCGGAEEPTLRERVRHALIG